MPNRNLQKLSSELWPPMQALLLCTYRRGESTPYHSRTESHALLTLTGRMTFKESGRKEFACVPGTFFVIPANASYKWRAEDEETTLLQCLHAPFSFLENKALAKLFGASNRHLESFQFEEAGFNGFRRMLERDMEKDEPERGSLLSADMLRMMAEAAAMFKSDGKLQHPALLKAVRYLEERLDRDVSLKELSRHAGLGSSRLSQLFRELAGKAPLQYHAHLRAARATSLFMSEGLRACEVAELLGFEKSYFHRFYKRQTGLTPGSVANRKSAHDFVI